MSIESDRDRLEILRALGEIVRIDGRLVHGIFGRSYLELDFDRPLESGSYELQVRDIDIKGVNRGATVDRNGLLYEVVGFEPDGEGMTILKLAEA